MAGARPWLVLDLPVFALVWELLTMNDALLFHVFFASHIC